MSAYYNEFDPLKAEVLREAIKVGAIAPGDVDERSISDVRGSDLTGYRQCHFFAGGGFWSLAFRQAGVPDDWPWWSGRCPCPSFSAAGIGGGFDDPRHLWPDWARLIGECKPAVVFGEQADDAVGYGWFDLVQTDLEAAAYAVGKVIFGAHSVGAPHIRQRLYFCADTGCPSGSSEQQYEPGSGLRWPTPAAHAVRVGPGGDVDNRPHAEGERSGSRLCDCWAGGRRGHQLSDGCGDGVRACHCDCWRCRKREGDHCVRCEVERSANAAGNQEHTCAAGRLYSEPRECGDFSERSDAERGGRQQFAERTGIGSEADGENESDAEPGNRCNAGSRKNAVNLGCGSRRSSESEHKGRHALAEYGGLARRSSHSEHARLQECECQPRISGRANGTSSGQEPERGGNPGDGRDPDLPSTARLGSDGGSSEASAGLRRGPGNSGELLREWRGPGWLSPEQARSVAAAGATRGFWGDCDWWYGRDDKYRPIGPGLQPLAHGSPARVGRLRLYGDGIVVPQAAEFVRAYLEARGYREEQVNPVAVALSVRTPVGEVTL